MRFPYCLVSNLVLALCVLAQGQVHVAYTFRAEPGDQREGQFGVDMDISGLPGGEVRVAIPAWKPGAYRIQGWNRFVRNTTARKGDGGELNVVQADDRTWVVDAGHGGKLRFSYRSRTLRHTNTWMSLEGPATWMYLPGHPDATCHVTFKVPDPWIVACGLEPTAGARSFKAPDYDTFADCPVELGDVVVDEWKIGGKPHFLTYNLSPGFDRESMKEMCTKIVEYQSRIFGGLPYDHYHFMWHLQMNQDFSGGLEHLNSTTLQIPEIAMRGNVRTMASLVAHEFFHLWNVKRIRPRSLGPFDYSGEVRVKSLWMCEGVTDYYADVTCVRTGIWSTRRYLVELAGQIRSLQSSRGYLRESVEDASMAVWGRRFGLGGIDYYNMGKLIGLLLDIEIRHSTENRKSLDDVMRLLQKRFGLPKPGFLDEDIVMAASEVAGRDMKPWFSRYVSGTEPLPFQQVLAKAGLDLGVSRIVDRSGIRTMMPDVGAENVGDVENPKWKVVAAPEGNPFKVGDVVLRFGSNEVQAPWGSRTFVGRNMRRAARRIDSAGGRVSVSLIRGGMEMLVQVPVPVQDRVNRVVVDEQAEGLAAKLRMSLLPVVEEDDGGN